MQTINASLSEILILKLSLKLLFNILPLKLLNISHYSKLATSLFFNRPCIDLYLPGRLVLDGTELEGGWTAVSAFVQEEDEEETEDRWSGGIAATGGLRL